MKNCMNGKILITQRLRVKEAKESQNYFLDRK